MKFQLFLGSDTCIVSNLCLVTVSTPWHRASECRVGSGLGWSSFPYIMTIVVNDLRWPRGRVLIATGDGVASA